MASLVIFRIKKITSLFFFLVHKQILASRWLKNKKFTGIVYLLCIKKEYAFISVMASLFFMQQDNHAPFVFFFNDWRGEAKINIKMDQNKYYLKISSQKVKQQHFYIYFLHEQLVLYICMYIVKMRFVLFISKIDIYKQIYINVCVRVFVLKEFQFFFFNFFLNYVLLFRLINVCVKMIFVLVVVVVVVFALSITLICAKKKK